MMKRKNFEIKIIYAIVLTIFFVIFDSYRL